MRIIAKTQEGKHTISSQFLKRIGKNTFAEDFDFDPKKWEEYMTKLMILKSMDQIIMDKDVCWRVMMALKRVQMYLHEAWKRAEHKEADNG